jgi:DNA repair protein RAD5
VFRIILTQAYEDGKTRYLSYARSGTVKSNTIAILAIITRLRQACLHPSMLVGRSKAGEDQPGYTQVRKMVAKWMAKGGMVKEAREAEESGEVEPENDVCARCGDVSRQQELILL